MDEQYIMIKPQSRDIWVEDVSSVCGMIGARALEGTSTAYLELVLLVRGQSASYFRSLGENMDQIAPSQAEIDRKPAPPPRVAVITKHSRDT